MLAESANLMMLPGRARDNDRWIADAKLMLDAGEAAYRAALKKDVQGMVATSGALSNRASPAIATTGRTTERARADSST